MTHTRVAYSCSIHEVCALENIWRDHALRAREDSLSFIFYRILPLDVVRMIARFVHPNHTDRAVDVVKKEPNGEMLLELRCPNNPRMGF